ARRGAQRARARPPAARPGGAQRDARRPAGGAAAARVHAAAEAARRAGNGADARAARGIALRLGRQRGKQRARRARAQPAPEALSGSDPHRARRRLRRRPGLSARRVNPRSIRTILLGGSVAVLLGVLGAAAWIGFSASQDEADEVFDARLATSARVLATLVATQPRPPAGAPIVVAFPAPLEAVAHDEAGPLGHHYETKIAFQ